MGDWQMNEDEANALAPQGIPGTYANIESGCTPHTHARHEQRCAQTLCVQSRGLAPARVRGALHAATFELTGPTAACEPFADAAATDAAEGCSQRTRRSGREPCRSFGRADGTRQAPAGRLLVA
jgi:hypothetical protein